MKTTNNFKSLKRLSLLAILTMPFISLGQWAEIPQNAGMWGINKIDCIDGNNCFIGGNVSDLVLKTTDGGVNWTDVGITSTATTNFLKMFGSDTTYLQRGNVFYKTNNGGINWETITLSNTIVKSFFNPRVGFGVIVGQGLSKTIDYGNTWLQVSNLPLNSDGIGAISFVDELVGIVIGGTSTTRCIYKTVNGGQTWVKVFEKVATNNLEYFLLDIQMVTTQVGFACGTTGIIVKTVDGGNTWVELTNPVQGNSNVALNALDFINTNSGYVVGTQGTIIKTTDGGNSWVSENYSIGIHDDVKVADLNTVYTTYTTSNILKNSNAGLVLSVFDNNKLIGKIFPNPTKDFLNISIEKEKATVRMLDAFGKEIFIQKLNKTINNTIDLQNLHQGIYFYEIYDNLGIISLGKLTKN